MQERNPWPCGRRRLWHLYVPYKARDRSSDCDGEHRSNEELVHCHRYMTPIDAAALALATTLLGPRTAFPAFELSRATLVVAPSRCRGWHGERQRHHLSGEDGVVGVDQLDLHLVLAWRQPGYVDGVVVTRIRPQPGQVVDGYVQMPETRRYVQGTRSEHR